MNKLVIGAIAVWTLALGGCAASRPLVSFDTSLNQVAVPVSVKGTELPFLLDTAVTPSVIDLVTAEALGVSIDRGTEAEGGGTGSGKISVYTAQLPQLKVGTLEVSDIEILAADLTGLSRKFGRRLGGVLGDSFLKGRVIGIDYATGTVHSFRSGQAGRRWSAKCKVRHLQPLTLVPGDVAPLLVLSVAGVAVPVSLDTGSALQLELYNGSLAHLAISSALGTRRPRTVTGSRGESAVSEADLQGPISLGPVKWDQVTVTLSGAKGSPSTRLGNLGNQLLRGKRLLLNYKDRELGVFDDCYPPERE